MKNKIHFLILGLFFGCFTGWAQVGIGTNLPSASTQLEIVSSDRGILIPRVELLSASDESTITNGNVNSLLVFNISDNAEITPGYYYWYENSWRKISDSTDSFEETITTLVNNGEGVFTYTSENGTETEIDIPATVVQNIINEGAIYTTIIGLIDANEKITVLQNNGDGTYTYYNEEDVDASGVIIGTGTTIDVVGDVVTNIQNQGDIYDEIINMLDGKYGNVVYNETDNTFYYIDDNGDLQPIDWSDFNTTNQSFELVNDQLVITDSDGNTVALDVEDIANNSTFITTLTANQEFIDEIINMLDGKYGNVVFNEMDNTFYYIDDNGDLQPIDWSDFNTTNQSFELVNDQLVITDSDGNTVALDVEDIANNSTFITTLTQNQEFIDEIINMLDGKYGNVVFNETDNTFYYIDDNGDLQPIDWSDFNTTNQSFELVNDQLVITDSDGNTVALDVEDIANNSTFITTLTANQEFIDEIINMLDGKYGNVVFNETDNTFYYIDDNGDLQPIDWSDFNTTNQSFELVNDQLVITDSDGNTVALDASEIANNSTFITTLTANQEFIDEIINMLDGKYGNVVYNETDNTFYYIDDNGDLQPIDWSDFNTTNQSFELVNDQLVITDSDGNTVALDVEDIANNSTFITTLTANQEFIDEIINMLDGKYGNVVYNETDNTFYYIDDNGDLQPIDISEMAGTTIVKNSNVTYTGDIIDGLPVVAFEGETHINANEALTSGVDFTGYLPAGSTLAGVVRIALYQNGGLITTATTDITVNGNQIDFNIGVGNMYQVLPAGDYDVIVYATLNE